MAKKLKFDKILKEDEKDGKKKKYFFYYTSALDNDPKQPIHINKNPPQFDIFT